MTVPNPQIYPYIAGSTSKPRESWIGFDTLAQAMRHASYMNEHLDTYGQTGAWNYDHWPAKPFPWIGMPNPFFVQQILPERAEAVSEYPVGEKE